jgi:hypothetical protein
MFKWTFLSLLLIALLHNLYNFFQSTLTVPKIKDLVNKPAARYQEILNNSALANSSDSAMKPAVTSLATPQQQMQNELSTFLNVLFCCFIV